VKARKGYEGKRPQTLLRLTVQGRTRFLEYLGEIERVLRDAQEAASASVPAPVSVPRPAARPPDSRPPDAEKHAMEVIRAEFSGMCFGVRDALAAAAAVPDPGSVTILGELVHNPVVNSGLAARGFGVLPSRIAPRCRPHRRC